MGCAYTSCPWSVARPFHGHCQNATYAQGTNLETIAVLEEIRFLVVVAGCLNLDQFLVWARPSVHGKSDDAILAPTDD